MGGTSHFFSALSKLYRLYLLYSARKYVGASMRVTHLKGNL
jgi:hypothetical protein